MTIVETPLKLIEVGVKVLFAELMVTADDRPLEQAPDALHRVRVNVAAHPLVTVVDNGRMPLSEALVSAMFVGSDTNGT